MKHIVKKRKSRQRNQSVYEFFQSPSFFKNAYKYGHEKHERRRKKITLVRPLGIRIQTEMFKHQGGSQQKSQKQAVYRLACRRRLALGFFAEKRKPRQTKRAYGKLNCKEHEYGHVVLRQLLGHYKSYAPQNRRQKQKQQVRRDAFFFVPFLNHVLSITFKAEMRNAKRKEF